MEPEKILKVVLREMQAYATDWRMDWSDFDGRTLRDHLGRLAEWAEKAKDNPDIEEYTDGTEFAEADGW